MDENKRIDFDKLVVYDIETMINCFIICFYDIATCKRKEFVIFNDDEYSSSPKELLLFLRKLKKQNYSLIGFNSINFDGQVLEYFISNFRHFKTLDDIVNGIYSFAQELINLPDDEKIKFIKPEYRLTHRNIDLFKQKHYDGKAKMGTSLKWLQFSMGYHNIEEMPISHDTIITKEQIAQVVEYCWNDVMSTYEFFTKIKFETELRESLSAEYNLNLLNASEPRMAKDIFGKFLCEEMEIEYKQLKELKTIRGNINVKDIIFDYISFYTEPFKNILADFNKITIDASPTSVYKLKYNFSYKGMSIDLGLGGIHGCNKPGVYSNSDEDMILDIDASSFYPNLAIKNNLKPQHLGDAFLKVYSNLYKSRKKIDKKDPRNYVYKIILNSCYGLSKEINSYLYDPKFTYGITINGQLSLLMLMELLGEYIKGIDLIQINTDGISIKFKRKDYDRVMKICSQFEKVTSQSLEYAEYDKMIIRDVNNYIARDVKGIIKRKGCFDIELDYHKNPSFRIVPKAISAYFLEGIDVKSFITESNDILDFCGAVKRKSNFDLNLYMTSGGITTKEKMEKVTRYYVASNNGGSLIKDYHDGRQISAAARLKVLDLNNLASVKNDSNNINKQWYISQALKTIETVEGTQQLKMF